MSDETPDDNLGPLALLGSELANQDLAGASGEDEPLGLADPGSMSPSLRALYERGSKMANVDFDAISKRQRAAVEEKRAAIQRGREALLGRQPDSIEILLALAKGFGSPTRTGSFAETLGNVAGEALPAVSRMNAAREAREQKMMDFDTSLAGLSADDAKLEYDQLLRRAMKGEDLMKEAARLHSTETTKREQIEARKETARLIASLKQGDSGKDWEVLPKPVDLNEAEAEAISKKLGINVTPGPKTMMINKKTKEMFPVGTPMLKDEKPPKIEKVDAGTEIRGINSETGEVVWRQKKNVAERETEEVLGTTRGKEIAAAPGNLETATNSIAVVKRLLNHKGLNDMLGVSGMAMRNLPGTEAADALSFHDQVKDQAFLQAFNTLKGGGAITEAEGKKATSAITRMNLSLNPRAYREAAKELMDVLEKARLKAEKDTAEYHRLQLKRNPSGGN